MSSRELRAIMVRFDVQDSGIGIGREVQARLFQAFTQADGSSARKYGGTGLGLAIAKQLVEMRCGEIAVQSTLGKGSTFQFTALFEKQVLTQTPAGSNDRAAALNLRVLVVQPNPKIREMLCRQIGEWKSEVSGAANGQEAFDRLQSAAAAGRPFDLALLDLEMPDTSGLTLSQAIKANSAVGATRLALLVPPGKGVSAAELKQLGIEACLLKPVRQLRLYDYLSKPVRRPELRAALERWKQSVQASDSD
jgi:two-component system, sensor histidine kinase and response regulator